MGTTTTAKATKEITSPSLDHPEHHWGHFGAFLYHLQRCRCKDTIIPGANAYTNRCNTRGCTRSCYHDTKPYTVATAFTQTYSDA